MQTLWFFVHVKQSVQGGRLRVWKNWSSISIDWHFNIKCNKLKLEDDMKITYSEKPCKIYLKTVCTNVIKGHHLKRNTYLQIMSIGFWDMMWKIFTRLMNLTNEIRSWTFLLILFWLKETATKNYRWIKWLILMIL